MHLVVSIARTKHVRKSRTVMHVSIILVKEKQHNPTLKNRKATILSEIKSDLCFNCEFRFQAQEYI